MMIAGAELGDFFHHLLLLVDLDGEHAPVLAGVIQGFNGLAEGFVDTGNARIQNIFHPQQHGHVVTALMQTGDDFRQGNLGALGALRADDHFARVRNIEVAGAPVADAVKFDGIFHPPLLQCAVFGQRVLLGCRRPAGNNEGMRPEAASLCRENAQSQCLRALRPRGAPGPPVRAIV